ncbi:potassium-transporting ATPase subunit F [Nocardiopsis exhalans]|uniref:Potassium-transporting ATPase subunit F n=1 Tax=Nocardiopsis exhalans TaxID=163604 RepID=A0ABY5D8R5_9ACTN|nr:MULTISPECIES: potassium-transporting ATPase subunit F [Nocardiopsis]USY20407.1 potassium-transporting ATPase subunit F [Nocardiopsis exhalans]
MSWDEALTLAVALPLALYLLATLLFPERF